VLTEDDARRLGTSERTGTKAFGRRFSLKYFSICGAIWQFVTSMDRKLHVSKIAWLLGFQEVSAFTHAFQALDRKDAAPNAKPLLSTPPQRLHRAPRGESPSASRFTCRRCRILAVDPMA